MLRWTEGRALIATGSPFFPVMWEGGTVQISQANNALVFPGVGLGALVSDARVITDGMFAVAAERLAELVDAEDLAAGALFPSMRELRTVTAEVAVAVARAAREEGIGRPLPEAELPAIVRGDMWDPVYEPLIRI